MIKTILAATALTFTLSTAHAAVPSSGQPQIKFGKTTEYQLEARRKARVPGGSGCDSAQDRAEHPECNG